jgi:hypothetical protein
MIYGSMRSRPSKENISPRSIHERAMEEFVIIPIVLPSGDTAVAAKMQVAIIIYFSKPSTG